MNGVPTRLRTPSFLRRLVPPAWIRALLAGHSALGLACSMLIYLICLSGTLAVFAQELPRWEQPSAPTVNFTTATAISHGFEEIRMKAPDLAKDSISVDLPTVDTPRFTLSAGAINGIGESWYADADGNPALRTSRPATDFIVALHSNLLLPRLVGAALVGLVGVALLALLISGILAHPQMFREAFALRLGGSLRLQEADLHNRTGTWGLPFHLMIALTGAVLGLSFLMLGGLVTTAYNGDVPRALADVAGPTGAKGSSAGAALPPLAPLISFVSKRNPLAEIGAIHILHPWTRGEEVALMTRAPGQLSLVERYVFDATGRLVYASQIDNGPIGRKILLALQPLHFGWLGGIGVKIIYAFLGLSLCILTSSGVTIWLARRHDKGRPARTWERLWAATVWGQPAACAVAALSTILWHHPNTAATGWAVCTAIFYSAACIARGARLFFIFSGICTGFLLAALGTIHCAIWWRYSSDAAVWSVDGLLLAVAAIVIAKFIRMRDVLSGFHPKSRNPGINE